MASCTSPWVGQRISLGAYQNRVLRPKIATSSQDRASWAWRTMGQRRSQCGQRQPFLKGLTQRWSSVSRCLNEKAVIFRSFRRSIFASNVRLLMGFLSLSISSQQLRGDPCLPSIASPCTPRQTSTPPNAYPTLARLHRHTHQTCLIIKPIPWGKSDRAKNRCWLNTVFDWQQFGLS